MASYILDWFYLFIFFLWVCVVVVCQICPMVLVSSCLSLGLGVNTTVPLGHEPWGAILGNLYQCLSHQPKAQISLKILLVLTHRKTTEKKCQKYHFGPYILGLQSICSYILVTVVDGHFVGPSGKKKPSNVDRKKLVNR